MCVCVCVCVCVLVRARANDLPYSGDKRPIADGILFFNFVSPLTFGAILSNRVVLLLLLLFLLQAVLLQVEICKENERDGEVNDTALCVKIVEMI